MFWGYVCVTIAGILLVYTYAIFPLLMALIPMRKRPEPRKGDLPTATLIIPAYNEELVIGAKLDNAQSVDYPGLKIVVASDGSSDRTNEIVEGVNHVQLLVFSQRRGKASVLNDALEAADSELIFLCDANVFFQKDAPRRLAEYFADESIGAVSGDVQLQSSQSSFGLAESLYYGLERRIHRGESRFGAMIGVDGGMYAIRRELFQTLAPDTILDDFTTSMNVLRGGHDILYVPDAIASESATESATSEFKRRVRLGAGAAQVIKRGHFPRFSHPLRLLLFVSHKLLRWLSPFLLMALVSSLLVVARQDSAAQVILATGLIVGALATVGAFSRRARRRWVFSVPFYFVLSQLAMGYGLLKGLFTRQVATWERTDRMAVEQ